MPGFSPEQPGQKRLIAQSNKVSPRSPGASLAMKEPVGAWKLARFPALSVRKPLNLKDQPVARIASLPRVCHKNPFVYQV
jgi:hypothetical protein